MQRLLLNSHTCAWLSRHSTHPNDQHDCDRGIINHFWNLGMNHVHVIILHYMELMIMTTSWMFCMLKQGFGQFGHSWANTEWDWESPASHDVRLEQYEGFNHVSQSHIRESFCAPKSLKPQSFVCAQKPPLFLYELLFWSPYKTWATKEMCKCVPKTTKENNYTT